MQDRVRLPLFLFAVIFLVLLIPPTAHSGSEVFIYLPAIYNGQAEPTLIVDPQSRDASLRFYHDVYLAAEGAAHTWSGNHAACDAGSTSQAFRDAILLRINYFRAMAGIPPLLGLNPEYNHKAQQAALMMSVNRALSHNPPSDWECYTAEGDQAAGSSNLFLGVYGVAAIDGYIYDPGAGNYPVGHRRWILYPYTRHMGTGDIPPGGGNPPANALWVFDADRFPDRPATREPYVAWPPPGYVPYQVVYPRWSFAYPGADFSAATVTMTRSGVPLPLNVQPVVTGYGDNTLVWQPDASFNSAPTADTPYTVHIQNVLVNGMPRSYSYTVTVFDPQAGTAPFPAPPGLLGRPSFGPNLPRTSMRN